MRKQWLVLKCLAVRSRFPSNRTTRTGSAVVAEPVQCYVVQPVTATQRLTVLGAVPGDQSRLPGRSGRRLCCPRSPVRAAPELGARAPRMGPRVARCARDAPSGRATVRQGEPCDVIVLFVGETGAGWAPPLPAAARPPAPTVLLAAPRLPGAFLSPADVACPLVRTPLLPRRSTEGAAATLCCHRSSLFLGLRRLLARDSAPWPSLAFRSVPTAAPSCQCPPSFPS